MFKHEFIFTPGIWIGEGKITFNTSPEHVRFYTKWIITKLNSENQIDCQQAVEVQGNESHVINEISVNEIKQEKFLISLENNILGKLYGKGIVDKKTIAWEYGQANKSDGFEVYELQDNGDYMVHAEYASAGDSHRTIIDGRIWRKIHD